MASGDVLLDASGNVILDASGNVMLSDGTGDGCCCQDGPDCSCTTLTPLTGSTCPSCLCTPRYVRVTFAGVQILCYQSNVGGDVWDMNGATLNETFLLEHTGTCRWEITENPTTRTIRHWRNLAGSPLPGTGDCSTMAGLVNPTTGAAGVPDFETIFRVTAQISAGNLLVSIDPCFYLGVTPLTGCNRTYNLGPANVANCGTATPPKGVGNTGGTVTAVFCP